MHEYPAKVVESAPEAQPAVLGEQKKTEGDGRRRGEVGA